ncbi:DUF5082 family protein [Bacillus sp. E(2018)]|uniref:YwqH-like family protein n=1 Tax=Bacillus sp. E(2018) TaxID=2502239 RepID=UPI0010F70BF8|nr:DUF5082 family protein [Bacillus sp. E(2018)]
MKDNSQLIMSLNSSISNLTGQMNDNQEKINLLRKSHSELTNEHQIFDENKSLINKPSLDSSVWNGKSAVRFSEERSAMEQSYISMSGIIENQLEDIMNKINELESSNASLANSISSKRTQLSNLK